MKMENDSYYIKYHNNNGNESASFCYYYDVHKDGFHLRITLFMIVIYLMRMVAGVENPLIALIAECESLQENFIVGLMR